MAETENEDRTQAPSNPRRQRARERGQVAHSVELSSSAGLLAAAAALSVWGDGLGSSLLSVVRATMTAAPPVTVDAAAVVSDVRQLALDVAWPLGLVLAAFSVASIAAHQLQTGGLWAPALLAPDPARLWAIGQGGGFASRAERGLWGVAKTAVIVAVAAWAIQSEWQAFPRLGDLETPALAQIAGQSLRHLTLALAAATLALGVLDFGLQHRRFEALLRLTPEEHREDLRSMEGDPSLRARRRRLARSWRGDSADLLVGSSLLLTGPSGLTVVLAGGPPPRFVAIRSILTGSSGDQLRRAAERTGVAIVSAPALARRLAQRRPPSLPPAAEHLAELASLWGRTELADDDDHVRRPEDLWNMR